ncbi:hypothetical protein NHJ13734_004864 [Beauveria thailandica]
MDQGWSNAFWGEATSYLNFCEEVHFHPWIVVLYDNDPNPTV